MSIGYNDDLKMFRPDMVDSQPPENVDLSNIPDRIGDGSVKGGLQLTTKRQKSPESAEKNKNKRRKCKLMNHQKQKMN